MSIGFGWKGREKIQGGGKYVCHENALFITLKTALTPFPLFALPQMPFRHTLVQITRSKDGFFLCHFVSKG